MLQKTFTGTHFQDGLHSLGSDLGLASIASMHQHDRKIKQVSLHAFETNQ